MLLVQAGDSLTDVDVQYCGCNMKWTSASWVALCN